MTNAEKLKTHCENADCEDMLINDISENTICCYNLRHTLCGDMTPSLIFQ